MKLLRSGDESHEQYLSTVQLLDSEVEALRHQIAQLNGHAIELFEQPAGGHAETIELASPSARAGRVRET